MIKSSGGLLSSKTVTTSVSQSISIKSTRRTKLDKLIVKDVVPASSDARIKVNIIEPKGLEEPPSASNTASKSTSNSGSNSNISKAVQVGPGIKARWAPTAQNGSGGDTTSAENNLTDGNVEGTVEWICQLDPGSYDLQLAWEVVAPAGLKWTRLWKTWGVDHILLFFFLFVCLNTYMSIPHQLDSMLYLKKILLAWCERQEKIKIKMDQQGFEPWTTSISHRMQMMRATATPQAHRKTLRDTFLHTVRHLSEVHTLWRVTKIFTSSQVHRLLWPVTFVL